MEKMTRFQYPFHILLCVCLPYVWSWRELVQHKQHIYIILCMLFYSTPKILSGFRNLKHPNVMEIQWMECHSTFTVKCYWDLSLVFFLLFFHLSCVRLSHYIHLCTAHLVYVLSFRGLFGHFSKFIQYSNMWKNVRNGNVTHRVTKTVNGNSKLKWHCQHTGNDDNGTRWEIGAANLN